MSKDSPMEGFLALAQGNPPPAQLVLLIKQVLKHPDIFVFGEFLELRCIQELETDTASAGYLGLLKLFAYGDYKSYNPQVLPPLGPAEKKKLLQLTVLNLAAKETVLPYDVLKSELGLANAEQRAMEDVIIDTVYTGLLAGKLDQQKKHFIVEFAAGRDVGPGDVKAMDAVLGEWLTSSETVLAAIDQQIVDARTALHTRKEDDAKTFQQQKVVANSKQMDALNSSSSSSSSSSSNVMQALKKGGKQAFRMMNPILQMK
jgi:COP9 signalosome complex subunit 7